MALWVWVLYLDWDGTANVVGCSHIATNLCPHRVQANMSLCVDIDILWHKSKAYMVIFSTSQPSIYMYNC